MRLGTQKGMTLVELLMAVIISTLLMGGVVAFATFFTRAQHEYQSDVELTNDARLVLERMVWGEKIAGVANRRGIAEARTGTIQASNQFMYTDVNGVQHTIRVNAGTIEYQDAPLSAWVSLLDPNGSAAYDPTKYSTSLSFTQGANPNSVVVQVVVGKNMRGLWRYGSASTQVFYRNAG